MNRLSRIAIVAAAILVASCGGPSPTDEDTADGTDSTLGDTAVPVADGDHGIDAAGVIDTFTRDRVARLTHPDERTKRTTAIVTGTLADEVRGGVFEIGGRTAEDCLAEGGVCEERAAVERVFYDATVAVDEVFWGEVPDGLVVAQARWTDDGEPAGQRFSVGDRVICVVQSHVTVETSEPRHECLTLLVVDGVISVDTSDYTDPWHASLDGRPEAEVVAELLDLVEDPR